ncbi:TlpA family protein disulfide reductase [Thiosocius teredinicola]|uniref:TlpA family protein disulfide reductase n=1 Tax=Thiosocius teredinicola TaxID=1973002 RepID=UPI0013DDE545
MKINKLFVLTVVCTLIGAGVGFAWRSYEQQKTADAAKLIEKEVVVVDSLPDASYPDLHNSKRSLSDYAGKLVVVNFWATWCLPCREETPLFVELQQEFGEQVQFIGIAIDEVEPTREFANEFGVNYPILIGGIEATVLSRRLGNRSGGLPFTVVAAPDGTIVMRHTGGLKRENLEPVLLQHRGRG